MVRKIFILGLVIYCVIQTTTFAYSGKQQPEAESKLTKTEALLKETMRMNKRLKSQNKRLKKVWSALGAMCKALDMKPSEDHTADFYSSKNQDTTTTPTSTNQQSQDMYFISITSSGIDTTNANREVTISVTYKAPPDHTSSWSEDRQLLRSIKHNVTAQYLTEHSVYVSTQSLKDASARIALTFSLHSRDESLSLHFADNVFFKSGTENITKHFTIDDHTVPIIVPPNESLPISLSVNGNFSHNIIGLYFTFFGIETNQEPPTVEVTGSDLRLAKIDLTDRDFTLDHTYRKHASFYKFLEADITVRNNKMDIDVTMETRYARQGGLLFHKIAWLSPGSYVYRISKEKHFRILSNISGTLAVVPPNTYAVYPLPPTSIVAPHQRYKTIYCLAMGSPIIDVVLTKRGEQGHVEVTSLERVFRRSDVSVVKVYRLFRNESNFEGKYTCSIPGHDEISTTTELIFFQQAVIDRHVSGVTKNTSAEVEVRCQATGKPKPKIELRLYTTLNAQILDFDPQNYKVSLTKMGQFTDSVVLTISPADPRIRVIHCVTVQTRFEEYSDVLPIPMFGKGSDYSYFDISTPNYKIFCNE